MVVGHLAVRHKSDGHDVAVAALNPSDLSFANTLAAWEGCGVETFIPSTVPSGRATKVLSRVRGVQEVIRAFRPDVIFAHSIIPSAYVRLARGYLAKRPKVVTVLHAATEDDYAGRSRRLAEAALASPDAVIAVTQRGADNFRKRFKPRFPVEVIPNGIDLESITAAAPEGVAVRSQLVPGFNGALLTQIGRISPAKRQLESIRALAKLHQRGVRAKLVLAGIWEDAAYLDGLRLAIREEALEDDVLLLGSRRDVAQIMAASDVILMPSLIEAHSVAFLEGLASGRPMVASDISPFRFAHGYAGAGFIDPADADGFASALEAALASGPVKRDLEAFSLRHMCDRYAQLASALVAREGRS